MTPDDYRRAADLFEQLSDLPEQKRHAALAAAGDTNEAVRKEVLRLLEGDRKADRDRFLARRAIEDASALIPGNAPKDRPALLRCDHSNGTFFIQIRPGHKSS